MNARTFPLYCAVIVTLLTVLAVVFKVKQFLETPSALDPSRSELEVCWPLVAWRVGWQACQALLVVAQAVAARRDASKATPHPLVPLIVVSWYLAGFGALASTYRMCHDAAPQIWKDTLVLVLMITGICAAMALVGFLYAWYRSRTDKPSVETEQPSSGGRVVSDETSDSKEAILIEV